MLAQGWLKQGATANELEQVYKLHKNVNYDCNHRRGQAVFEIPGGFD
jgi:hypothetical protein